MPALRLDMPKPDGLDTLTDEQIQRAVNAIVRNFSTELMNDSLLSAFTRGGPKVDTAFRSPWATPDLRRSGEWTIERRLVKSPGRMTIDAEYEVVE